MITTECVDHGPACPATALARERKNYYRPKRKADLIRHLIEGHRRDHIVSGPNGSRIATEAELSRLYGADSTFRARSVWTVTRLTEKHDTFHDVRNDTRCPTCGSEGPLASDTTCASCEDGLALPIDRECGS